MAERLCSFVEGAEAQPMGDKLLQARVLLAQLLVAVYALPKGKCSGADPVSLPPLSCALGFGEYDIYWELFDPYEFSDAGAGSLSDDFLDIYRDLAPGLVLYEAGREGRAAWEWRFNFEIHWGRHAVAALRALHRACRVHADKASG